jgi:hypothetical protein
LLVMIDRGFEVRYAGLWAPDLRPTSLLEWLVTYDKVVLIHCRPQLLGWQGFEYIIFINRISFPLRIVLWGLQQLSNGMCVQRLLINTWIPIYASFYRVMCRSVIEQVNLSELIFHVDEAWAHLLRCTWKQANPPVRLVCITDKLLVFLVFNRIGGRSFHHSMIILTIGVLLMIIFLWILLVRRVMRVIMGAIMVSVNQRAVRSWSLLALRKLIILFLFLFF